MRSLQYSLLITLQYVEYLTEDCINLYRNLQVLKNSNWPFATRYSVKREICQYLSLNIYME
ncbi:hypothetical protein B9T07_03670 [Limnospira fusiformis CCALA 023]|uniref:Transposase n=1 Tax=Limnospira platensis NIES-46 TaxID=1236695 RepID=A0A5M3T4T0_LIMPL|nr:hypothetical protein NIES39_L05950 [Arthrospira platensis NIES-39]BDT15001.1 hypothetical protein N39L_47240 [Arthrospira platensis NIES-39]GCE93435.1 hypothetical protein NIES46_14850 [Arthrospira platensis NIES-46]